MNGKDFKRLERLKQEADRQIKDLRTNLQDTQKKLGELIAKSQKYAEQLQELTHTEVVVSEHAMLRYFERVMLYDLQKIEAEMIPDNIRKAIETIRSGSFTTPKCILKVRGGVITTVLAKDGDCH